MALGGKAPAPQTAHVQVYVDGVRMTRSGAAQIAGASPSAGPDDDYDVEHALKLVPPTAIQAMEIYTGVAQIPAEFLEDACAVIAIWTKSY